MVTHRMDFADVQAAYDTYEKIDDNVVKVVMETKRTPHRKPSPR